MRQAARATFTSYRRSLSLSEDRGKPILHQKTKASAASNVAQVFYTHQIIYYHIATLFFW